MYSACDIRGGEVRQRVRRLKPSTFDKIMANSKSPTEMFHPFIRQTDNGIKLCGALLWSYFIYSEISLVTCDDDACLAAGVEGMSTALLMVMQCRSC